MLKRNHNQGFTLLSVLISLSILLIILPILAPLLFQINSIKESSLKEQMSVSSFFHLLQLELNQGKNFELKPSGIYITQSEDKVILIERYRDNVRRRVNLTGHEVLLFNVQEITFRIGQNFIHVSLQMIGGNEYERTFYKLQT